AMNNLSRADARTQIASIAESMGLQYDLNRQVRTFSTGMMHRLGLARALLHRPAILFLDEPTRSLDPIAASEFRRLLKDDLVRSRGTTLLFASHTLSEVEEIADRVVLLDGGRVVACESPRELCASTRTAILEAAVSSLVGHQTPVERQLGNRHLCCAKSQLFSGGILQLRAVIAERCCSKRWRLCLV